MGLVSESGLAIASPAIVVAIGLIVARIGLAAFHRRAVEHVAADTIRPAARTWTPPWVLGGIIAPLLLTILVCAMTVGWSPEPAPAQPLFCVLVARGLALHFGRWKLLRIAVELGALATLYATATGPARAATLLVLAVLIVARLLADRPRARWGIRSRPRWA